MPGAKPARRRSYVARVPVLLVVAASSLSYLAGCMAAGPQVIMIPAIPTEKEALVTAETVKVRVLVTLDDGTTTISKNRLVFPPGSLIGFVPKDDKESP